MKRLIIMMMLFLASYIHGQFESGTGSDTDPYMISTPAQLSEVRNYSTDFFELMNDIDLDGYAWIPIPVLSGGINGANFTISNLSYSIDITSQASNGGFIDLINRTVSSDSSALYNIKFNNVDYEFTASSVVGTQTSIGGLIGIIQSNQSNQYEALLNTIQVTNMNISTSAPHQLTGSFFLGGILGRTDGAYTDIYRVAIDTLLIDIQKHPINSSYGYIGGLIGKINNTHSTEISTVNKLSESFVINGRIGCSYFPQNTNGYWMGGLIGTMQEILLDYGALPATGMLNCYFRGSFFGTDSTVPLKQYWGGLAANVASGTTGGFDSLEVLRIDKSFSFVDTMSLGGTLPGGISRSKSGTTDVIQFTHTYYNREVTVEPTYPIHAIYSIDEPPDDTSTVVGFTVVEFADTNSYDASWDFVDIWQMDDELGHPVLRWIPSGSLIITEPTPGNVYPVGDTVRVEWTYTDTTYVSVYANDIFQDSTQLLYYDYPLTAVDTVMIRIETTVNSFTDSVSFIVLSAQTSYIHIWGVTEDSIYTTLFNVDSMTYSFSNDSLTWTSLGVGYKQTDTSAVFPIDETFKKYIKVEELSLVDNFDPISSYNRSTSYISPGGQACTGCKWNANKLRSILDPSCGWVAASKSYAYYETRAVLGYDEQTRQRTGVVIREEISEERSEDLDPYKCRPDNDTTGQVYSLYWAEWLCDAQGGGPGRKLEDSTSILGRTFYNKIVGTDTTMWVYDSINDTAYQYFDYEAELDFYVDRYDSITVIDTTTGDEYIFIIFFEKSNRDLLQCSHNYITIESYTNAPVGKKSLSSDTYINATYEPKPRDYFRGIYPRMKKGS